MKITFLFMFLLGGLISASAQRQVEMIKLDQLQKIVNETSDDLKVINFWASWCGPCIKEMPHFDHADKEEGVDVYFISLDFPQDLSKVEKVINKKAIQSTTYLLDEKNYDKYITSIDPDWSGAIPATLFVSSDGKRYFYEKALDQNQLSEVIDKLKAND